MCNNQVLVWSVLILPNSRTVHTTREWSQAGNSYSILIRVFPEIIRLSGLSITNLEIVHRTLRENTHHCVTYVHWKTNERVSCAR
ncbi:hypothetical protein D9M68_884910 [compost metagenome]